MKTYGYARVSTAGQAEEGVSMSAQAAAITSYCETYGLDLVEIIEDAGQSAKTLRRPGMERLLALVHEGRVEAVIVYKMDRAFRSSIDALTTMRDLQALNIEFHSVMEQLNTSTAIGRFVASIISSIAELERAQTGERTAFALAHIKDKNGGRQINGMPPYGYKWKDGQLFEVAIEQRVLIAIKLWFSRGCKVTEITTRLNTADYQTRGGGVWHKAQVYRILHQEIVS